ncbi:hypothetical protein SLS56_006344 [Neofusicoccum ribis]|uniref:Major facilitator superfamily (MFS) profile domain-containing protein n=1 Tax=Neofusicoccum ribis TaxID=45134 RepID=A0ABR3SQW9_9PEZI
MVNWINYGLSFRGGSVAWRFPLAFQFFFIIILWATNLHGMLPNTVIACNKTNDLSSWLIGNDRMEEAQSILAALEAKPQNDPYVITQMHTIEFSVQYERGHAVKWRDLARGRNTGSTKTLRRLLLGAGTQFMQQFEGINIMSYYLPTVLIEYVGLTNSMARLLTACNATSYLIFSSVAIPLVEKWGRRNLMLLSTFGQFFSFFIITILLRFSENSSNGAAIASASIAFFFLYYIAFGIGMITNFVIVEITPIGIQNLGWRFWIVWTVFNAVFLPVIYLFYPETANRSLEDLDAYYRTNPPLMVIKNPDVISTKRPLQYTQQEDQEIHKTEAEIAHEGLNVAANKQ